MQVPSVYIFKRLLKWLKEVPPLFLSKRHRVYVDGLPQRWLLGRKCLLGWSRGGQGVGHGYTRIAHMEKKKGFRLSSHRLIAKTRDTSAARTSSMALRVWEGSLRAYMGQQCQWVWDGATHNFCQHLCQARLNLAWSVLLLLLLLEFWSPGPLCQQEPRATVTDPCNIFLMSKLLLSRANSLIKVEDGMV